MRLFVRRFFLFLLLPALLMLIAAVLYVANDPFSVVWSYDDYSRRNVSLDYVSTEMFKKNYPERHYNSFIFGSSRSLAYNPLHWAVYLDSTSSPYSYSASSERLYGIRDKLVYLDRLEVDIQNAIILIDEDITFSKETVAPDFLSIKHPDVSDNSWAYFHSVYFKTFLSPKYIFSYLSQQLLGVENKMFIKNTENITDIDPITNHMSLDIIEKQLKTDKDFYNKAVFYSRPNLDLVSKPQIAEDHLAILLKIKRILEKHRTDYRIVIDPLYNQTKLDKNDLEILYTVFGKETIYDFSGRNQFTESKHNYYEDSHFRPIVGDSILSIIYKKTKY